MFLGIPPSEVLNNVVIHKNIFIDMVKHGRRTVLNSVPSIVKTLHTSLYLFLKEKKLKSSLKDKLKFEMLYRENVDRTEDFYIQCVDPDFL